MFSRGIRTCSSLRYPLSTASNPNFGPMSPITIPEQVGRAKPERNKSMRDTERGMERKMRGKNRGLER